MKKVKDIFGDRDYENEELTTETMLKIGKCEIHLLNSIRWEMNIDLPFNHFNEAKPAFNVMANDAHIQDCFNNVLRDLCLIIKDMNYLKIPPIVSAAAAIMHGFSGKPVPDETLKWIQKQKDDYPSEFKLALKIIIDEGKKCVPVSK